MHPINWALSYFGVQLYKSKRQANIPPEFRKRYLRALAEIQKSPPAGFAVFPEIMFEEGTHPETSVDRECEFAAYHLHRLAPRAILDVGSYRQFISGLLANSEVTTIDVRPRQPFLQNEKAVTADAKKLPFAENSFDAAISLCTLEHLGLGRYGDEIDLDADKKALLEIARVLKKNGSLIFTTEIKRGGGAIAFNAHRIYSLEALRERLKDAGFLPEDERFFSRRLNAFCASGEITNKPKDRDIYLGCWKKA